ncbi:MAG: biotin/lipoyl-containing protein [Gemmatimonadaceae bacterium]|nr:biotin/lipoyl-containing protein [Gemmatimonadaceae bacterium]
MATKVMMEALSPTMEEGRLVKWLKNEGDAVKSGDTLAEVETDKAIMELVARGDGVLRERLIPEDTTAPVGSAHRASLRRPTRTSRRSSVRLRRLRLPRLPLPPPDPRR